MHAHVPGGHIIITMRAKYLELPTFIDDVVKAMDELETMGKWKLLQKEDIPGYVYDDSDNALTNVYVVL